MADNPPIKDLISLDDDTPLETGSGASSPDAILNAAEIFQSQLDQMTAWKEQLAKQMEVMHRDGLKLLERQKNLALEKQKAAEERAALAAERGGLEEVKQKLESGQKAAETARHELEIRHAELAARQKALGEQEARCLAEDVRIKETVEQIEAQRRQLTDAQREAAREREALGSQREQVAGTQAQLAARDEQLKQQTAELAAREQGIQAARGQLEENRAALESRQAELAHSEKALVEKGRQIEEELRPRLAEAQQLREQASQERQAAAKQKQEIQKKLELLEHEQAEQHEALSKQAKRLAEKRAEVEAAEQDIDKALADRISQNTGDLQKQLKDTRDSYEAKIEELQGQIAQLDARMAAGDADTQKAAAREVALAAEVSDANGSLTAMREELQNAGATLDRMKEENLTLARDLAAQLEQGRQDAGQWQAKLEAAQTAAQSGGKTQEELEKALGAVVKIRGKYDILKEQFATLKKAYEDLEFKVELQAEDAAKKLEAVKADLTAQLAARERELSELKEKLAAAKTVAKEAQAGGAKKSSQGESEKVSLLEKQVATLEAQRDDLAKQVIEIQDRHRRQQEQAILAHNALEGKLLTAEERVSQLEAEKSAWQTSSSNNSGLSEAAPREAATGRAGWQKERLLKQARTLREFRRDSQGIIETLEKHRRDVAQQREQLRARKENLEQVKRLLEKQEMVMARKLADHNAIKTVAAVGIFLIMILGSTFFGVYHFVHPVYRSEAVIKLAPNAGASKLPLQGAELEAWIHNQVEFIRSPAVTSSAWKILRSTDENYAMHDVRDEWLDSLPKHLSMQTDTDSNLTVRYTGPDAKGVSQVCNALATAYMTPGMRDPADQGKADVTGLGSKLVAKATAPLYPSEDGRMTICLSIVAIALFVSLLLVMLFRHFIARQLREIDQMADAKDLEDIHGDMGDQSPEAPQPA